MCKGNVEHMLTPHFSAGDFISRLSLNVFKHFGYLSMRLSFWLYACLLRVTLSVWFCVSVCLSIVCSRPEDGLRCRQGVKPPLNPTLSVCPQTNTIYAGQERSLPDKHDVCRTSTMYAGQAPWYPEYHQYNYVQLGCYVQYIY